MAERAFHERCEKNKLIVIRLTKKYTEMYEQEWRVMIEKTKAEGKRYMTIDLTQIPGMGYNDPDKWHELAVFTSTMSDLGYRKVLHDLTRHTCSDFGPGCVCPWKIVAVFRW